MYTPIPPDEKVKDRKQWRVAMQQDLPLVFNASSHLQDALGITSQHSPPRPVLEAWQFPQAPLENTSTESWTQDSDLIGSNEEGWAIPGAASIDGSEQLETIREESNGSCASSRSSSRSRQSDNGYISASFNASSDGASEISEESLACDLSDASNDQWAHKDLSIAEPCTLEAVTALLTSTTPTTPLQQLLHTPCSSQTTKSIVNGSSSTADPRSAPTVDEILTPEPLFNAQPSLNLLKHVFVNHEDVTSTLEGLGSLTIVDEDSVEIMFKSANHVHNLILSHHAHQSANHQHNSLLGSPYTYRTVKKYKQSVGTTVAQEGNCGPVSSDVPVDSVLEARDRPAIVVSTEGTLAVAINFDLSALHNGEVRIHGHDSVVAGRSTGIIEPDLVCDATVTPVLSHLDTAARVGKHSELEACHTYWMPSLPKDINYWLQKPGTLIAVDELASIALDSTLRSIYTHDCPICAVLGVDAILIRLLYVQLPDEARGLFAQSQQLDWVVIEICWQLPKVSGLVLALPRQSITSTEHVSDVTKLLLQQRGMVPAAFGIGVESSTLLSFMEACTTGTAVIRSTPRHETLV